MSYISFQNLFTPKEIKRLNDIFEILIYILKFAIEKSKNIINIYAKNK